MEAGSCPITALDERLQSLFVAVVAAHRVGVDAQELQVSLLVAEGATNREAAATLFVTPKTIETHLNHVYRKLGVRSRVELAAYLSHTATRT